MPTQEERLTAVEQSAINIQHFQDQAIRHLRELDASTTILLGVVQSQGRDIRLIFDQISEMRTEAQEFRAEVNNRFERLDTRIDGIVGSLALIMQKLEGK